MERGVYYLRSERQRSIANRLLLLAVLLGGGAVAVYGRTLEIADTANRIVYTSPNSVFDKSDSGGDNAAETMDVFNHIRKYGECPQPNMIPDFLAGKVVNPNPTIEKPYKFCPTR